MKIFTKEARKRDSTLPAMVFLIKIVIRKAATKKDNVQKRKLLKFILKFL